MPEEVRQSNLSGLWVAIVKKPQQLLRRVLAFHTPRVIGLLRENLPPITVIPFSRRSWLSGLGDEMLLT